MILSLFPGITQNSETKNILENVIQQIQQIKRKNISSNRIRVIQAIHNFKVYSIYSNSFLILLYFGLGNYWGFILKDTDIANVLKMSKQLQSKFFIFFFQIMQNIKTENFKKMTPK